MAIADHYLRNYAYSHEFLNHLPSLHLKACVVVPSYEEPDILPTLDSVYKAALKVHQEIELFVVINAPEDSSDSTLQANRNTLAQIEQFNNQFQLPNLKIFALNPLPLEKKFAGAGYARKIGMDEAVRRFNYLDNAQGLIINLDADSIVEENYFEVIFSYFHEHQQLWAANIYFEHPIKGQEFSAGQYDLIYKYELHLRYFTQMQKFCGFPFAFHTLGSAFAVKALAYIKQNGMNRKKAGEDFYFLHKLTALGNLGHITSTKVIPSARVSHRVPFGTGAFIREYTENKKSEVLTYAPEIFFPLKKLFLHVNVFYSEPDCAQKLKEIDLAQFAVRFLVENNFCSEIERLKKHTANEDLFVKQFFQWFNGFKMVKYCNFASDFCTKKPVEQAALFLMNQNVANQVDLLSFYRELDRKSV